MATFSHRQRIRSIHAAVIAGILIMFILDLILPLGVAVGVPYVAVVLLTLWLPDRNSIYRTAGVITVLAVIGLFSPVSELPLSGYAILNRMIALFVIWVAAVLGNRLLTQQEATRIERDFNESLVATASSIILLLDTGGRIIFFNQSAAECLGYRLADVQGAYWFEMFVPERDRPRARGLFQHSIENNLATGSQVSVLTRDGRELQFSWSTKPMQDAEGNVTQMLFVGQDITSLLEAQRRLVASERLAAIGQTIAAVSHETRNELMAMKLSLDLLTATVPDPAAGKVIEHLQNSQDRLHRLLDDLRHFAGPLILERSIFSLQEIWRRAWQALGAARKDRDAQLHETIECPGLECPVDALRIEQVFRNLFENSLAACSDPVWIEILATSKTQSGQPVLTISVRDNGPGLAADAKAKVFEPFFTTKQKGTGLGMAISARILEAHGGRLSIAETNGRGAEFVMELPSNE